MFNYLFVGLSLGDYIFGFAYHRHQKVRRVNPPNTSMYRIILNTTARIPMTFPPE